MKGKFEAYVLWQLAKKFQNWIVDWSTARNFTVDKYDMHIQGWDTKHIEKEIN